MKAFVLVIALLVALPAATQAADPIEVNAILSLTGSAAILGKPELEALTIAVDEQNRKGGIRGRQLNLTAVDDASNAQIALTLANGILARHASFVIGPNLTAPCAATIPVFQTNVLEYCLSPALNPVRDSYAFSAGNSTDDALIVLIRYFRLRGWTRIAMVTTTDASGQALDRGLAAALALPENSGVQLVAHEHFSLADITLNAQIARVKNAAPQAVIAWAIGAPFGTLLHGLRDSGLELPIGAASGDLVVPLLKALAPVMPKEIYFPGAAALSPAAVRPGPIHDALTNFSALYARRNATPEFLSTLVWDPTQIVFEALQAVGPDATAAQLRAYIAALHSWVGINGVYDFRDGSQRGIGPNTCVIDRWVPSESRFVAVSRPGGYLR